MKFKIGKFILSIETKFYRAPYKFNNNFRQIEQEQLKIMNQYIVNFQKNHKETTSEELLLKRWLHIKRFNIEKSRTVNLEITNKFFDNMFFVRILNFNLENFKCFDLFLYFIICWREFFNEKITFCLIQCFAESFGVIVENIPQSITLDSNNSQYGNYIYIKTIFEEIDRIYIRSKK
jgi:hypothetical protein